MRKYLSETERHLLKQKGIIPGEWIGGGSSCDVYEIEPFKGQEGLCIKYIYDARKKDVEDEYERYRRLYQTEPSRFAKVVDLLWINSPDEDSPEKLHRCAVIVMEKLSKVTEANLTMEMIVKLFFDCTVCLYFMHLRQIMHRDIKIENIMYSTRTGTFVLLDYGISAFGRDTFTENSCKGTPNNISPGALKGNYSPRDDLFSEGRMMRKIFVGSEIDYPSESELNGRSLFDYWYDQIKSLKPLDEDAYGNPELIRIINKLTEFERDKRYQNCGELFTDIKNLIFTQKINVGRLSQIPHDFYMVMVSNESREGITPERIRNVFHDYLCRNRVTNVAASVIPYSDTVYSRALNNGDDASAEVVLHNENSDFLCVLLNRIKKATLIDDGQNSSNVHVCAIGTKLSRKGIHRQLGGLKRAFRSTNKNPVAYRIAVSNDYAFDVSDIGVSEVVLVNNEVSFKRCLEDWFNSESEANA